MYKIGDNILQISKGIFIRLDIIIEKTESEYQIEWLDKGEHANNLQTKRNFPHQFIENNELFDLVNINNIDNIILKYILEQCFNLILLITFCGF